MDLNNGNYVLDIDNIINFCYGDDKITSSEITDIYLPSESSSNLALSSRQIREVKDNEISTKQAIKCELFKTFLSTLLNYDEQGSTFGETVIVNTMLNEGLIKEINEE